MTDYKAIHGKNILHVASDLDNAEAEGQIWFNTTSSDYKTVVKVAGAWSTGGNLNATKKGQGGGGTQTAAILAGGTKPPGNTDIDESEEYDGSSWTEGSNLNQSRGWIDCGGGTQTAGWLAGGQDGNPPHPNYGQTEHYNGSSWSEEPDMNTAAYYRSGNGTQTASLAAGGGTPSATANSEEFNGSSWTEGGNLNAPGTGRTGLRAGLQTAALCLGGWDDPHMDEVESYDGSSWTASTALNTARGNLRAMGIQTLANAVGGAIPGSPGVTAANEQWDGSSWTEVADLSNGRKEGGSAGTNAAGLIAGGEKPAISQDTEEWTGPAAAASNWDST